MRLLLKVPHLIHHTTQFENLDYEYEIEIACAGFSEENFRCYTNRQRACSEWTERRTNHQTNIYTRVLAQETLEERLERQARNRQETAAAEEHKKTDEFTETTTGTDPKTGEPLSSEERKEGLKQLNL